MKTRSPPSKELPVRGHLTRSSISRLFRPIAFRRILVPLDFSADSKNALHYAIACARKVGGSLTLLHVVEPFVSQTDFGYGYVTTRSPNQSVLKHTQRALNSLASRLSNSGSQALAVVRSGDTETEIVRAAIDFAADLIVIGSHGQSAFPIPIGGTAEKVVRNSPCPVLVVRRKQSQSARPPKRVTP
jgi:nucleotide-binding universal stress UspA family protein